MALCTTFLNCYFQTPSLALTLGCNAQSSPRQPQREGEGACVGEGDRGSLLTGWLNRVTFGPWAVPINPGTEQGASYVRTSVWGL